jgi:UDP-N-acetylmuramate--alanine ligase
VGERTVPGEPDLSRFRRVHVVAAGGAGMSAIATLLVGAGHTVTGSDVAAGPAVDRLAALGVVVGIGHDAANVGDAELVVASTAVADDNVELVEARRRGVPVLRRIDLLPALAARAPFLSVAGTHGKTTTSSLLAVALRGAGADPGWLIGADVPVLGGAARWGADPLLVLEADESDGSFLAGPRAAAVVTNLEPDHLEHWGGLDALTDGFRSFLGDTTGPRVVCADDPGSAALADVGGTRSYGTSPAADHRIEDLAAVGGGVRFRFVPRAGTGDPVEVRLTLPGEHNARNAAAALAVVAELGRDVGAAAAALAGWTGVARRFERHGEVDGVGVVDDYAHLPTEVRAALAAGRSTGPRRLVVVFQPHRYSRTQALWQEFGAAFDDADLVVLTDIYPAGEAPREGISGKLLVDSVLDHRPWCRLAWLPQLDDVVDYLVGVVRPGDLVMTVGAGDVVTVGDRLLARRAEHTDPGVGRG